MTRPWRAVAADVREANRVSSATYHQPGGQVRGLHQQHPLQLLPLPAAGRRALWSVRVCARLPYPCNTLGSGPNCSAALATAAAGAEPTSSGTNPNQGRT